MQVLLMIELLVKTEEAPPIYLGVLFLYTSLSSAIVLGVNGHGIIVEVDITNGIPLINVVGLADLAIRESVERVRSAIRNSSYQFPLERITINLAPADLKKEGTGLDLAIAAGILKASEQIRCDLSETLIIGELSLDGHIRPVQGVLAMLEHARSSGIMKVVLPEQNTYEASLISGMLLYPITNLRDLEEISYISSEQLLADYESRKYNDKSGRVHQQDIDISDVVGQQEAKRALLIAAAGRHNIIVSGPPGVGKTMLMHRLPTIMPPLTESEALEVTKIYSVAGKLSTQTTQFISAPPFRSPHHSISIGGLIGGGSIPKPGEVTLSHHGVLFLDELPEFSRQVLELLRQPIEEHTVTISRARSTVTFPASFLLAASYNPCPCGFHGFEREGQNCTCTQAMIQRYRAKLSGPLLDRIDLQIDVARPPSLTPSADDLSMNSQQMRELVQQAVTIQQSRYKKFRFNYNSELTTQGIKQLIKLPNEANELIENAFQALGMSMRGYNRIIKIARTIADLAGSEEVQLEHVAEAIQYRKLDIQLHL